MIRKPTPQKWPGTAQKTGIEADAIDAINYISLLHLGTAPPLLLAAELFSSTDHRSAGHDGGRSPPQSQELTAQLGQRRMVAQCTARDGCGTLGHSSIASAAPVPASNDGKELVDG
ncbi:MAG: hypothetical protein WA838_04035, partial [Xanthobacteraceae bacterium]